MTYHIIMAHDGAVLGASSPVIKAHERTIFCDAIGLFDAAKDVHKAAERDAHILREAAYQAGLTQGRAEALTHVTAMIERAVTDINEACARRRDDIAEAALAATQAIIGHIDDQEVAARLVNQALMRMDSAEPITVEVAPAMLGAVAAHIAHLAHVRVEANAGLGPLDCTFLSENGRVIAGLDVQIAALAQRWGVETDAETGV